MADEKLDISHLPEAQKEEVYDFIETLDRRDQLRREIDALATSSFKRCILAALGSTSSSQSQASPTSSSASRSNSGNNNNKTNGNGNGGNTSAWQVQGRQRAGLSGAERECVRNFMLQSYYTGVYVTQKVASEMESGRGRVDFAMDGLDGRAGDDDDP